MSGRLRYFLRQLLSRLLSLASVMLVVSFLTFVLYYFAPGDKALAVGQARYGGENDVQPELIEEIRTELGLNEPMLQQYLNWLKPLLQGDFGHSWVSQETLWSLFLPNLYETLTLASLALLLGLLWAFALSTLSVRRPGSWVDRLAIAVASVGAAMPAYWLGLILILIFSAQLRWLPAYGSGSLAHLILPATTLALWVTSSQTRLFRSFLLEAQSAPFVEALRLRHVSEREIFWRHLLRHAAAPAITMIGVDMAGLLEGTVIIEVIFSRGGIGSLLVSSVLSRNYPVLMFLVLFAALSYVLINTLTEMIQDAMTPSAAPHFSQRPR